jgi:hypothetical protein
VSGWGAWAAQYMMAYEESCMSMKGTCVHGRESEGQLQSGCTSEEKQKQDEERECTPGKDANEEIPAKIPRHIATDCCSEIADTVSLKTGVEEGSGQSWRNEGIDAEGANEGGGRRAGGWQVKDGCDRSPGYAGKEELKRNF